MQTTNLGNVAIQNQGVKRSKFPINRNIYTTCGFGEVQPVQLLPVKPHSATGFNMESLDYLASLVSPTFGHVNLEYYHYFVAYEDLFTEFPRMMAETARANSYSGQLQYITNLPFMTRKLLASWMLWGAHLSIYEVSSSVNGTYRVRCPQWRVNDTDQTNYNAYNALINQFKNDCQLELQSIIGSAPGFQALDMQSNDFGIQSCVLDLRCILDDASLIRNVPCYVPLSNPNFNFFGTVLSEQGQVFRRINGVDVAQVDVEKPDFLFEKKMNGHTYILAFRMHAFGSRIAKLFHGTQFQEDWTSYEDVSMAPLCAVFKAYYDCFGLVQYENFDYTNVGRAVKLFNSLTGDSSMQDWDIVVYSSPISGNVTYENLRKILRKMVIDMGSMWATAPQDYLSAHTNQPTVSPSFDMNLANGLSRAGGGVSNIVMPISDGNHQLNEPNQDGVAKGLANDNNAYLNTVIHGQVDCELLKRLYWFTNANTLAGKRIEQVLRAQGYGDWVDHCKPRFIGHDKIAVDFSQVISTANTYQSSNGQGSIVGERGGRGQAYGQCKTHFYANSEEGMIITLMTVVPDAGYCQAQNIAYEQIAKNDFFLPMLDGVSKELTPLRRVLGNLPTCLRDKNGNARTGATDVGFGYIPMQSRHKVFFNVLSGDFARMSRRDDPLTYCMDKILAVGSLYKFIDDVEKINNIDYTVKEFREVFPIEETPKAGNDWRYFARYPWLGNFNRIFAALGASDAEYGSFLGSYGDYRAAFEYFNDMSDGFLNMVTQRGETRFHALPITDSFETREEGNKGNIDTNISKA